MFSTLKNAFKIKEIRGKLLFTFLMLVVIRFGSQLPIPGVNRDYFASWFEAQTGGAFNFLMHLPEVPFRECLYLH